MGNKTKTTAPVAAPVVVPVIDATVDAAATTNPSPMKATGSNTTTPVVAAAATVPTPAETKDPKKPVCVLDQRIVNADTIGNMSDIGISFFATLCGRNRGAFVLDPPDGHTWGCTAFPSNFAELAGCENAEYTFKDANAIKNSFVQGNITADDTVAVLDYFLKMVYHSSANVDKDPFACETGGLAHLQCDPVTTDTTIRSVTLAGLFTKAPWATKNQTLTVEQAKEFYTMEDFQDIKKLGLNTVQIPFPLDIFLPTVTADQDAVAILEHLTTVLGYVQGAGLKAILLLEGDDNDDAVAAAAHYAMDMKDTIYAMTVPSAQSLGAARAAETSLKLMVPVNEGELKSLDLKDEHTYAAIDLGHSSDVGDIASSTSVDDRMKLFYHEAKSCIYRSPLEYSACYRGTPVFVASGFDLSVDDCINQETAPDKFVDYGQCERFLETVDSAWWARHRASFLERQLFSYEQGLGWSYAAWKLYDTPVTGELDTPYKLLSLKDVAAAGLYPELAQDNSATLMACLNPPISDFVLGDDTVSPTPGPPPDCGYGWWNETIQDCSYWIPPAPTPSPTDLPTQAPFECPEPLTTMAQTKSGIIGAVVALIVGGVGVKLFGRRTGYETIPN